MRTLIVGLVLFFLPHSVAIVAPAWRDRAAARLGAGLWQGLYSLVSAVGLLIVVWGFSAARLTPLPLYTPPIWLRGVAVVMMIPVFPLVFATYLPGRIRRSVNHPLLAAVMIWALAHLLATGLRVDALVFGSFLVWALADRMSLGRRPIRAIRTLPPSGLNDLIALIGGVAVYGVMLLWLHLRLFGVQPPW